MNLNPEQIRFAVWTGAFLAAGILGYLFCPKDLASFRAAMRAQRSRKSGILLVLAPFLSGIGDFLLELPFNFVKKYLEKIRKALITSELDQTFDPQEFAALQVIAPLPVYPVLALAAFRIPAFQALKTPQTAVLVALGVYVLLFFIPLIILKDKVQRRQRLISRELPFALDMLTSAVQAGLDFSGAIRRFIKKADKMTPLKNEFSLMLKEMSLGKSRADALSRMAERVNLPELTSVVNSLIQADQLGTSIGHVLTTLSDDLRVKRFQRAEKLALEAPVKMLFPLIAFIFPAVFIILIGPLILQISGTMGK
jgi:tight adherence protein C